ncbi:MAG: hypothetical protein ACRELZ_13020 [Candidatus Rokuibacteriota bacterium]
MRSPTFVSDPQDFSLVLGGPLYQAWRRLFLSGPALEFLVRRMISIPSIAWLPLLVLTVYEGVAVGGAVPVPFLKDFEVHARYLVAIPILLLAEILVHQRIRVVVRTFVDAGIVTAQTLPGFLAAIASAMRLRNSLIIELAMVVFVFGFGWTFWAGSSGLASSTWFAIVDGAQHRLTIAGWWYVHVSIPIFQLLLFRWYFRLVVWFLFLRRLSRLPLRLTPTHPDRAGGLGFLGLASHAFVPVILAQSVALSAVIGSRIIFQGRTLVSFQYEIAAFVILQLLFVLGPPCVFMKTLLELKRQGRREYGILAARYTTEFHEKWIQATAPAGEQLVGSADIQSLADLANSYDVVGEMKPVPFGRDTIVQVVGAAAIPLLPLALTVVPAEEILRKLFTLLL